MIEPNIPIGGKLSFLETKQHQKRKTNKMNKIITKRRKVNSAEEEEKEIGEMTETEIKFQTQRINYIKNSLEKTKGKTHKELIEEMNKTLEKIPLHNDLEGK